MGIVVGALFVGPAVTALTTPAAAPAALQTRVSSCTGQNFQPINSTTEFAYHANPGIYLVRRDEGETPARDGWFVCDPNLPQRAVVTKVQFTMRDSSSTGEVRSCSLARAGLRVTTADTAPEVEAQVTATGVDEAPGIVRRSTSEISNATIDNASWGYWLQCTIHFADGSSTNGVGISGAAVTYRISAANG